jgi:NADPH:quinone reductase-like Zn-dependent oxidoreductase
MNQEQQSQMRVVHQERYGGPEELRYGRISRPVPGRDEVLVRVRAAGLNPADCFLMRGAPVVVRFMAGLLRPKPGIPGMDVAGDVVSVGAGVARFRPGDEVFGCGKGTCAEFACAPESTLSHKPAGVPWEAAAALPIAGLAALHAIRDTASVKAGQQVLIIGASGGVGSFAVQLAARAGAEVTAVCSAQNAELVRALGAHHVIDYHREDVALTTSRYDVILDNIENRSLAECRRVLKPEGMLILNSGTGASGFRFWFRFLKPLVLAPFVRHRLRRYVSIANADDLQALGRMLATDEIRVPVDRRYPLKDTADALAYIETGRARGKVVVHCD